MLYFFLFACLAFQGRFMSLFLLGEGLTNTEVGIILSASSVASMLATPLWAALCDHTGQRMTIVTACGD